MMTQENRNTFFVCKFTINTKKTQSMLSENI